MEKIYTQEQKEQKERKQKKGLQRNVDFSVALSVIVAAFALFSVASFNIMNRQEEKVSYAAPTGDTFKMVLPNANEDYTAIVGYPSETNQDEMIRVPFYYADSVGSNNHVFCTELRKQGGDNQTYTIDGTSSNDPGLIYILNHSIANGQKILTNYTGQYEEQMEVWAAQVAIWRYLAKKNSGADYQFRPTSGEGSTTDSGGSFVDTKTAAETATYFIIQGGPASEPTPKIDYANAITYVNALLTEAEKQTASSVATVRLNRASDQLSKTEDGKYYQTLYSVTGTPANAMTSYDITLLDGVDGIKVVDENGKDLQLTNIPAGKKFYVRIPVDKVGQEKKTVRVKVVGHVNVKTGVYYAVNGSTAHQRVITLKDHPENPEYGDQISIVGSPDTGMNAAQTIYFIGLIVLLCGVGIVYANTKPVESKQ